MITIYRPAYHYNEIKDYWVLYWWDNEGNQVGEDEIFSTQNDLLTKLKSDLAQDKNIAIR